MAEIIKTGSLINGRYEILELVGSGGMADVYKAQCLKLNRFVAIKFLKKEFLADREFVERFDAEARAAAGITHPNIVSVYDVGLSDAGKYIVMEYVEGITLKEYIDENGKITWREAASVAGQISSALSCAHKNGIIHRDIKPHNIIITTSGNAKVTDFGIAKAVSQSTIVKNDGNILGSAHYFSPEQGVGGAVDSTTDIYSMGVVMFEMLTGRVPFDNSNPLSLALMHSNSPVPEIDTDAPQELKKIVYTAMSKNKADRYSDAAMMLADIKSVLRGGSALNAEDTNKESSEDKKKAHGVADSKNTKLINSICIAAIGIVVVIILVATISFISSMRGGENRPDTTPSPTAGEDTQEGIEVLDVVNHKKESAIKTLENAGFKVVVNDVICENDNQVDKVITQQPQGGTMLERGSEVMIFVGKKFEEEAEDDFIQLEKVVGLTKDAAVNILESAGFKVSIEYKEVSLEEKNDIVIEQNPLGGERLKKRSTVGIVVGKAKEKPEPTDSHSSAKPSQSPSSPDGENTPTPTSATQGSRTELVSFTVPDGEGSQWVRVTVAGGVVFEKTYNPGEQVFVTVELNPGEKKTVVFYVNDRAAKQTEVSY